MARMGLQKSYKDSGMQPKMKPMQAIPNEMADEYAPEEGGLEIEISMAEEEDDAMYQEMAPRGKFKTQALNTLVKASNRLLPMFGQTPDYPQFDGPIEIFPTDFVRVLAMFKGAIDQAISEDIIPENVSFEIEDIKDDSGINVVAGKLNMLPNNRDFKKWIKASAKPEEEAAEEVSGAESMMEGEAPSPEQLDKLFSERM